MTTVEVTDRAGGSIRSTRTPLGLINVNIYNPQTDETIEYLMDPKEPKVIAWLESIYQPIHLNILLG
ncbi:MAG: hypothetical protein KBA53_13585 [Thermoclostridium sp.]|nr:hypothetical protein [Thermoclostridium sp.]